MPVVFAKPQLFFSGRVWNCLPLNRAFLLRPFLSYGSVAGKSRGEKREKKEERSMREGEEGGEMSVVSE